MNTFISKSLKALAAATLLATASGAQAAAVLIDFENDNPTTFGLVSWSQNGLTLTSNQPAGTLVDNDNLVRQAIFAPGVGNNTQAMFFGANGATSTVTMTHDSGFVFDLLAFDASSLYNGAGSLTIEGTLSGGGTVSQNIALTSDLTTINVIGMTGLTSLDFTFDGSTYSAPYDLDNISLNVVPIPAAVWLFASGMGLLTFMRRKA